jgi:hypothetical protein
MSKKKKYEEKTPTKTKIFIPPSTQRMSVPGFRGCTIDADSADKILYTGGYEFKLSMHDDVAKMVDAEVPYVSISDHVIFKPESLVAVYENVYFSFNDPTIRSLDINLDKSRLNSCIFSTVIFRNCRFSDSRGTGGGLQFVTHFGTIERVIFEDCTFDDDTKLVIDKGVTVALVRCNVRHDMSCTSFSTAVPENSLILYDTLSGDVHTDCVDYVIIDTAGRQHTRRDLMDELAKVKRIIGKECPEAPHEIWLTVDSSIGTNALIQAREFGKLFPITGLILTKLDGTGKGGVVVAIKQELGYPVRFIGLGEQVDDLQPFDQEAFVKALFE